MKVIGKELTRAEMSNVIGGQSFTCYCGFVGGSGEDDPFTIESDGILGALGSAGRICNGQGATCSGNEPAAILA